MPFYLVPGVCDTQEPGARCPMCTFNWCQVSEIPQNLVPGVQHAVLLGARYKPQNLIPGVPDTPEPHARCPFYTFTWCQES